MWSIDRRRTTTKLWVLALAGLLIGCTPGIQSGDVTSKFTGVKEAQVISPTAVKLYWQKSEGYDFYDVYADYSVPPIATQVTDSALIEGLSPSTEYVFKVVGRGSAGTAGTPREIKVTTWPRFEGVVSAKLNPDGHMVVSWEYPYAVDEFLVYYDKEKAPTQVSTDQWTEYQHRTSGQSVTFKDLKGSVNYYFMVHARYRGDEFERPMRAVNESTNSSFPKPSYTLPPITIGGLPQMYVDPAVNATFKEEFYTSTLFKDDATASDPLIGKGWLTFSPSLNLPLGKVDNISLKMTYSDNVTSETLTIKGLSTYLKGVTPFLDLPPQANLSLGQAFMGRATAAGDFNCDGYDDLAVGLPEASLASLGATQPRMGAVYIYYGGFRKVYPDSSVRYVLKTEFEVPGLLPSRFPLLPGVDPQIITFDDLTDNAQFGASLFGRANLNGDVGGTGLPCQDLIVGAPEEVNPSRGFEDGNAFVFFGSPDGLKAPTTLAAMSTNASTCDGRYQGASCTAVRIFDDYKLWPSESDGPLGGAFDFSSVSSSNSRARFGAAVAGIGDFDGDGYEDLAIGAPTGRWDGKGVGVTSPNVDPGNPGFVAIYFGSKFGLGAAQVTTGFATNSPFRFVKVYAPMPKDGMHFGSSIAGGVDVDGRSLITTGGVRVGGADMVIGAPRFNYVVGTNAQRTIGGAGFPWVNSDVPGTNRDTAFILPFHLGPFSTGGNYTGSSPGMYGFTSANARLTGAAFLYFGRTGDADQGNGTLENFWGCGKRGMENSAVHFSCLTNRLNWRMLFPRSVSYLNTNNYHFGSTVMLLGNSQARNPADNTLYCPPVTPPGVGDPTPPANCTPNRADANGDGLGDVLVVAPNGNGGRGEIWQFFGNVDRVFEGGGTNDLFSGNATLAETYNTSSFCTNFASTGVASRTADKRACAPTLVRSSTIPTSARMGLVSTAIDRGDLTGDGLEDVAIGAAKDNTIATDSGAVYIFTSSLGQGLTSSFKKIFGATSNQNDGLGHSVAIGDFDVGAPGKINDVVAGAPNDNAGRAAGGSVRLFLSGNSTLPAIKSSIDHSIFDHFGSYQNYDYSSARIVGDINGDGYEDGVAHMASFAEDGAIVYDAVVYFGSPMGLITTTFCLANQSRVFVSGSGSSFECYPAKSHSSGITQKDVTLPQLITLPVGSTKRWAEVAYRAGDVNGDGYADVALVDPVGPQLVIYYGTRGGLQDLVAPSFTPAINDAQVVTRKIKLSDLYDQTGNFYDSSNRPFGVLWYKYANAIQSGDLNGDGYADLVIADASMPSPKIKGVPAAGDGAVTDPPRLTDADVMCYDSDNNGAADCTTADKRALWSCDPIDSVNSFCIEGTEVRAHGIVYVFYGGPGGMQTPSTTGTGNDNSIDPNTSSTAFKNLYNSESVAGNRSCSGGICVPGYLRNPIFLNIPYGYSRLDHQFGASIAVMNVNGDDTDDLVVSAPGYEHPACWHHEFDPGGSEENFKIRNAGRVYVFYGSKNDGGLRADSQSAYFRSLPTWQHLECLTDNSENALATSSGKLRALQAPLGIELWDPTTDSAKFVTDARETAAGLNAAAYRSRLNRSFGMRVENMGDVNKDGFEDLIVTAPYENVLDSAGNTILGAGVMYVYYGPLCGTDNLEDVHREVQSVGRVNKINTFLNTLPGVTPVADCQGKTLAPQRFFVQDAVENDRYGHTASGGRATKDSAGNAILTSDVNLDGFGDVLIGSFNHDDPVSGAVNSGRGVIYFGSSTGLYTDDFPSAVIESLEGGRVKPYMFVPPQAIYDGRFFQGNVSSGDVNGDKANDFMIPSFEFDGEGSSRGIELGTFFMFY